MGFVVLLIWTLVVAYLIAFVKESWFWYSQGVPGPLRLPIINNAYLFLFKPLFEVDYNNFKKYGPVYVDHLLPGKPTLNILDPQMINQIFVTDFNKFTARDNFPWFYPLNLGMAFQDGNNWKRLRSIITPIFSSGSLRQLNSKIQDSIKQSVKNIHEEIAKSADNQIDYKHMMHCLTTDIVCSIVFSAQIDTYKNPDIEISKRVWKMFYLSPWKMLKLQMFPVSTYRALNISWLNEENAGWCVNFFRQLIEDRRKHPEIKYNDLLQRVIDTEIVIKRQDLHSYQLHQARQVINDPTNTQDPVTIRLSDDEVIGQVLMFLLAAMETQLGIFTQPMQIWAEHPQVQQRIHDELTKTYGNASIDYDNAFECKYFNACLDEAQRVKFSLSRQFRSANEDYYLNTPGLNKHNQVLIRRNQVVSVSTYTLHHNDKHFPDPFKYRPERFLNDEIIPGTYLPFGSGPRTCIGMRFVRIVTRMVLGQFIREFQYSIGSKSDVPLKYVNMSFVMDYERMWLTVSARNKQQAAA